VLTVAASTFREAALSAWHTVLLKTVSTMVSDLMSEIESKMVCDLVSEIESTMVFDLVSEIESVAGGTVSETGSTICNLAVW